MKLPMRYQQAILATIMGLATATAISAELPKSPYTDIVIPDDASIRQPDASTPLAAYSGMWCGIWPPGAGLNFCIVVEKVEGDQITFTHVWGDAPEWRVSKGSRRHTSTGRVEWTTTTGTATYIGILDGDVIRMERKHPESPKTTTIRRIVSGQDVQAATDLSLNLIAKQNTIVPPDSSVPKDCAVFSGAWGGEWRNGGYRSVLRVLSIDSSCIAAYSINGLTGKSKISDGKLEEFLCLQRTDGRCTPTWPPPVRVNTSFSAFREQMGVVRSSILLQTTLSARTIGTHSAGATTPLSLGLSEKTRGQGHPSSTVRGQKQCFFERTRRNHVGLRRFFAKHV